MITEDRELQSARVSDLIEQIDDLNKIISNHQKNSGDQSTIDQYKQMRDGFLSELNKLMKNFHLNVHLEKEMA